MEIEFIWLSHPELGDLVEILRYNIYLQESESKFIKEIKQEVDLCLNHQYKTKTIW